MDARIPQGAAEFGAQQVVHRAHHEIHDGLGSVDDAVGVGQLDGEALEKAFVHGVEKDCFCYSLNGGGGGFDGQIEAVQFPQEVFPG